MHQFIIYFSYYFSYPIAPSYLTHDTTSLIPYLQSFQQITPGPITEGLPPRGIKPQFSVCVKTTILGERKKSSNPRLTQRVNRGFLISNWYQSVWIVPMGCIWL